MKPTKIFSRGGIGMEITPLFYSKSKKKLKEFNS